MESQLDRNQEGLDLSAASSPREDHRNGPQIYSELANEPEPKENRTQPNVIVAETLDSQSSLEQLNQTSANKCRILRESASLTVNANFEPSHLLKAKDDETSQLQAAQARAKASMSSAMKSAPKLVRAKEDPRKGFKIVELEKELGKLKREQQTWLEEKANLQDQIRRKDARLIVMQEEKAEAVVLTKQLKELVSKNERKRATSVEIGELGAELLSRDAQISELKRFIIHLEAEKKTLTTRLDQFGQETGKHPSSTTRDPVPYIPILHKNLLTGLPFGINTFDREAKLLEIKSRPSRKQTFDQRLASIRAERGNRLHVEPIRWDSQHKGNPMTKRISTAVEPRVVRRRESVSLYARKSSRETVDDDSSDSDYYEDASQGSSFTENEDGDVGDTNKNESDEDCMSVGESILVQDMQTSFEEALGVPRPAIPTLSVDKKLAYRKGGNVCLLAEKGVCLLLTQL